MGKMTTFSALVNFFKEARIKNSEYVSISRVKNKWLFDEGLGADERFFNAMAKNFAMPIMVDWGRRRCRTLYIVS